MYSERRKAYNVAHKAEINAYHNAKGYSRKARLRKYYNMTVEEYNILFDGQEGRCAICGIHQDDFKERLSVDHNHATGKVRGLLCNDCNRMLGGSKDSVESLTKAIEYLNRKP